MGTLIKYRRIIVWSSAIVLGIVAGYLFYQSSNTGSAVSIESKNGFVVLREGTGEPKSIEVYRAGDTLDIYYPKDTAKYPKYKSLYDEKVNEAWGTKEWGIAVALLGVLLPIFLNSYMKRREVFLETGADLRKERYGNCREITADYTDVGFALLVLILKNQKSHDRLTKKYRDILTSYYKLDTTTMTADEVWKKVSDLSPDYFSRTGKKFITREEYEESQTLSEGIITKRVRLRKLYYQLVFNLDAEKDTALKDSAFKVITELRGELNDAKARLDFELTLDEFGERAAQWLNEERKSLAVHE